MNRKKRKAAKMWRRKYGSASWAFWRNGCPSVLSDEEIARCNQRLGAAILSVYERDPARWPTITADQRRTIERFNRLFVHVPMSDVEKEMPDPDHGL